MSKTRRTAAALALRLTLARDHTPAPPAEPEPVELRALTAEQRQTRLDLLAAAIGPAPNRAQRRAMARSKSRADRRARRP